MMDDIESFLKDYSKPRLTSGEKIQMKNRILTQIRRSHSVSEPLSVFQKLIVRLKAIAESIRINAVSRVQLKEALMASIEQPSFSFASIWNGHRRWVTTFAAVALVLVAIFNPAGMTVPISSAHPATLLEVFQGNVKVKRGNTVLPPSPRMKLQEGDVVQTGKNGFAEIRYFNGNVSRLYSNTEVALTKLVVKKGSEPLNVEVNLTKGQMWSHTFRPLDVKVGEIVASPHALSAFNVSVHDDGRFTMSVWRNVVDVAMAHGGKKTSKSIKKGYQIVKKPLVTTSVVTSMPRKEEEPWVKENLAADKKLTAEVREDALSQVEVGVLPDSPLYAMKTIQENASLMVKFGEANRNEFKIELAKKRFLEGMELLRIGKADEASKIFAEFQNSVSDIATNSSLQPEIEQMLGEFRQALMTVSNDDPLYAAKLVVKSLELQTAPDRLEQEKRRIIQLSDTLIEAQILDFEGKREQAKERLESFQEASEQIRSTIESLNISEQRELVPYFFEQQAANATSFSVLSESVVGTPALITGETPIELTETAIETKTEELPVAERTVHIETEIVTPSPSVLPETTETTETVSEHGDFMPVAPELSEERLPSRIQLLEERED